MKRSLAICVALAVVSVVLFGASAALAQGSALWNRLSVDGQFWQSVTVEEVREALDGGADANARGEYGRTPLHLAAAWSETPGVIEALLAGGADVNVRDESGETPLHVAAAHSEAPGVVKALLAGGADVDALDDNGRTPLAATNAARQGVALAMRGGVVVGLGALYRAPGVVKALAQAAQDE